MKITFLGAAQEVTGSCYLVETEKHKFMVDCGLFQGSKELEQKNHDEIDFNEVEFMLLTHAHIDHTEEFLFYIKMDSENQFIAQKLQKIWQK